jgi:RNA polymerase sigma factor (sigma-70 family)
MNKSRTLSISGAWLATRDLVARTTDTAERVRTPDEQVTLYYREHAEALFRYLTGIFGCEDDAEEITQEAFLRLYEALDSGKQIDKPEAWVFTVARRLMLDRLKQTRNDAAKYREFGLVSSGIWMCDFPAPDEALIDHSRTQALKTALRELPEQERQFLYARAQGQKLRQIGEETGMDVRRVSEVIARAIKSLQRLCD